MNELMMLTDSCDTARNVHLADSVDVAHHERRVRSLHGVECVYCSYQINLQRTAFTLNTDRHVAINFYFQGPRSRLTITKIYHCYRAHHNGFKTFRILNFS